MSSMIQQKSISIFHPQSALAEMYVAVLAQAGINASYFPDAKSTQKILDDLTRRRPNLAIIAADFSANGREGLDVLAETDIPVIIQHSGPEYELEARELRAVDYFSGVMHANDIKDRVMHALTRGEDG